MRANGTFVSCNLGRAFNAGKGRLGSLRNAAKAAKTKDVMTSDISGIAQLVPQNLQRSHRSRFPHFSILPEAEAAGLSPPGTRHSVSIAWHIISAKALPEAT